MICSSLSTLLILLSLQNFAVWADTFDMKTFAGGGSSSANGIPATNAAVGHPYGLWKNKEGSLYYSEIYNNCVRKVDNDGIVFTVAGESGAAGGSSGDGGPATSALLNWPLNVAVADSGDVFIADFNNAKIRMVSAAGIMSTVAGNGADGYISSVSRTSAAIGGPLAVWVNTMGELFFSAYCSATNGHFINLIKNGMIQPYAGNSANTYDDGMAATSTTFADIGFLTADTSGRLLLGTGQDKVHGGQVKAISPSGIVSTVMGTGTWNYNGEGLPASSVDLMNPNGIAVDGVTGDVYTSLYDGQRVMKLSASSGRVYTFAGTGSSTGCSEPCAATSVSVMGPYQVWVDSESSEVFLADSFHDVVHKAYPTVASHHPVTTPTFAPVATKYLTSTLVSGLFMPSGVFGDSSGVVYFSEIGSSCVRKVLTDGTVVDVAGVCQSPSSTTSGDSVNGEVATSALLHQVFDVTVDPSGVVYLTDYLNFKIKKVNADGRIYTFAGNGGSSVVANGVKATSASIASPWGMWLDSLGQMYFSIYQQYLPRYVKRVGLNSIITAYAGAETGGYVGAGAAATSTTFLATSFLNGDTSNNIYLADGSNFVKCISGTNRIVSNILGSGVKGYSGEGLPATSSALDNPNGVLLDAATGDLYASIFDGQRVQKLSGSSGLVSTFAGTGTTLDGEEGGDATATGMVSPHGMWMDSTGAVYVADSFWQKVRRVAPVDAVIVATDPTTYPSTTPFSRRSSKPSVAPCAASSASPSVAPSEASDVDTETSHSSSSSTSSEGRIRTLQIVGIAVGGLLVIVGSVIAALLCKIRSRQVSRIAVNHPCTDAAVVVSQQPAVAQVIVYSSMESDAAYAGKSGPTVLATSV